VSDRTIKAAIEAGARDVDAIGKQTGAGITCTDCRPAIEELLKAASDPTHVADLSARRGSNGNGGGGTR
jgi:bacterioferritin-associated ferredoxin